MGSVFTTGSKDALVLSSGGLFAAYQAGVYKALWPYWKPDLIVGTSAGALNAWLIATTKDRVPQQTEAP